MATSKERLKILNTDEVHDLYALPRFTYEDRCFYFTLSPEEKTILNALKGFRSKLYFVLQLGYFNARRMFFTFIAEDIAEDVQHILTTHFPGETIPRNKESDLKTQVMGDAARKASCC